MAIEQLTAYELIQKEQIPELNSTGYLLKHRKTGARVALLENDDENKVFTIGFRTPPSDSTGVPHIMEHSVLCGSEEYPVKDPFVELVKGSLNTFLNAMTYPDKTLYPVASCNEKDFQNLMDVYMDAVLHPNIYHEEKIFRQEGWHYELADPEGPLIYNGVVYNEMKGVYSSPESMLDRYTQSTLFPDNCYGRDSGGDPAADEVLAKHAPWAAELRERHTFTADNVDAILRDEVGKVFARVLEHAGVFKCDEPGRRAFLRFVETVR